MKVRQDTLHFHIGQTAERSGEWEVALRAYAQSEASEARVRHARLLERLQRLDEAEHVVTASLAHAINEAELQQLRRIEFGCAAAAVSSLPACAEPRSSSPIGC